MTPARKAALQWFHDRGEVQWVAEPDGAPSIWMRFYMLQAGQISRRSVGSFAPMIYSLTDAGRRALEDAGK